MRNKKGTSEEPAQLITNVVLLGIVSAMTLFTGAIFMSTSSTVQEMSETKELTVETTNTLVTLLSTVDENGLTYAQHIELSATDASERTNTQKLIASWMVYTASDYYFTANYKGEELYSIGVKPESNADVHEALAFLPTKEKKFIEIRLGTWSIE